MVSNIIIKKQNEHLKKIKKKAGPRYTPELNVNLPISGIFDGICRTENFYLEIRKNYGELLGEFNHITSKYENNKLQREYNAIRRDIEVFFVLIENIKTYDTKRIPWEKINNISNKLNDCLWRFSDKLRKEKELVKEVKLPPNKNGSYQQSPSEKFGSDIHYIYKTQEAVRYFENLSSSTKAKLSNNPFLLLTGSAGTGKTHLLCDVVEHRIKNDLLTFMVFGESFSSEKDFWSQFLNHIDIGKKVKTKEEFLKSVNELGKRNEFRSLIVIDALNENITHAPSFWRKNLYKIIQDIKRYPHIALTVSVRNGFEKNVLLKKTIKELINVEHNGFHFKEWEAVCKFFSAFSLPLPEIPLLMSEFQNPLFLLLFCKAFQKKKNKKNKQIFRGHEGATYIFEQYTDSIAKPIEDDFGIDHGPNKNIWDSVIEKIAAEMVKLNSDRIPEKKLVGIIQESYPHINSKKFLQKLESNTLIVKTPRYNDGDKTDGFDIRFPFQKFSDHLIGRYIFKKYREEFLNNSSIETAKKFFSRRRKLGKFISKSWNRGIIEALSIQCPEQLKGTEFIEVAPYLQRDPYLSQIAEESFVESLIWRHPKAFSKDSKNTLKIINDSIIRTDSGHNNLLNAFLTVAPIPKHPFNAERLHEHLSKFKLPNRDSWWSPFLHYQYGEQRAVDRLLEWSWSDQEKIHLSDNSIFLTSIALSWFLTTSNRFVRDRATKGLVCLLQNRIHLLLNLLKKFKNVNDLYVAERLYAVAYGCVLRNQEDSKNLKALSEWIYKNIFEDNKPPVHILLRDYARGIIKVALKRGIKLKINKSNINPPYKSEWPKRIPTEKALKKKYYPEEFFNDKTKDRGFLDVWSSVMYNYGSLADFGNYVVNSHLYPWSGRQLKHPEPNRKKLLESFKKKLTSNQNELLEKATNPFFGIDFSEIYKHIKIDDFNDKEQLCDEDIKKQEQKEKIKQKKYYDDFEKSLTRKQLSFFKNEIKPFLDERGNINDPSDHFDTGLAQRWIFNRVVKLGYCPTLHGEFDRCVNSHISDRREHKAERIGKKYQWIAYHEFIALVSDHFEFKGDSWNNSNGKYKGPWHPYIRDIDSSFTLKNDNHIKNTLSFSNWKANKGKYDAWEKGKKDSNWLTSNTDLPNPKNIIRITDDNGDEWFILGGFLNWKEKTPPEYKEYDIPHREVWYMIKSYIVKKKDAENLFNWSKKQDFMGRWMPESSDFYEIFLGEYPSAIAFEDLRGDYNIWTKINKKNNDLQIPVVVTDDSYLNEFTLDCSHDESISIKLPSKWIVNKMNLNHKYLDGRFYDKNGNLVTVTTSIFEENFPSALLINKKALTAFLNKNNYSIVWTVLGEKQLIGGNMSGNAFIGRLEISGAYTLSAKENVIGKTNYKFTK